MNINIPGGNEILYPTDIIVVAGSDDQIIKFSNMLSSNMYNKTNLSRTHVTLERFRIGKGSHLIGLSISKSRIREDLDCIIMAIERDDSVIMNPVPSTIMMEDDIVVVAGETEKIHRFENLNLN
jgi:CPA2 family monovalent cation:H+ antiporter-2